MRSPLLWATLALSGLVGAPLGCADGGAAQGAGRVLSPYEGRSAKLFDDGIDADAVGLELDASKTPRSDAVFRERAQLSDAIVRAKILTVSSKDDEQNGRSYYLTLKVLAVLGGAHPPAGEFNVVVDKHSPALGIVRSFEDRLVSMNLTFIAFVHAFAKPDSDGEIHVHLSADTPEKLAAVREAATLADMK